MPAENPAKYHDVEFDRGPQIVDRKLVQRIEMRSKRDTANETACQRKGARGELLCLETHALAKDPPKGADVIECGCDCHLVR